MLENAFKPGRCDRSLEHIGRKIGEKRETNARRPQSLQSWPGVGPYAERKICVKELIARFSAQLQPQRVTGKDQRFLRYFHEVHIMA